MRKDGPKSKRLTSSVGKGKFCWNILLRSLYVCLNGWMDKSATNSMAKLIALGYERHQIGLKYFFFSTSSLFAILFAIHPRNENRNKNSNENEFSHDWKFSYVCRFFLFHIMKIQLILYFFRVRMRRYWCFTLRHYMWSVYIYLKI